MKQKKSFVMLLAVLMFPLLACILLGQARLVVKPEAVSRVDEILTRMTRDGAFSGSVLIAQDGVVFLSKGYGLADRVQGIPNTPQTRFHLGSMTKQFTAMGILILESQGKLNVQDPICTYITNCPEEWQDITIHHLLTHTSGLSRDQSSVLDTVIQSAASGLAAPAEQAKYLGFTIRWLLDAKPGEQYAYSNFGYYVLTHIIEQVSGQTYPAFLDQAIFTPLNMHNTEYQDGSSGVALTYLDRETLEGGQFGPYPVPDGAGNLYSTCEDLLLWDQALNTGQLLPRAELDRMFTPFVRKSDLAGFGYGYGWFVTKILGRPILASTGGGPTFTTTFMRLPVDGVTLIVLKNQAGLDFISIMVANILAITGGLFLSDLVFLFSALAFNLFLTILFIAQRNGWVRAVRGIGIVWLLLAIPLVFVFARYLAEGRGLAVLVLLALVLLYMLMEFLLDFVFKVEFRRSWKTHVPYIILEYIALFSLIRLAFNIHRTYGYAVSITFWILLAGLIYLFWDKIWVRKRREP
jgi:CubicO group peptidase (beta-lactamase class C family)